MIRRANFAPPPPPPPHHPRDPKSASMRATPLSSSSAAPPLTTHSPSPRTPSTRRPNSSATLPCRRTSTRFPIGAAPTRYRPGCSTSPRAWTSWSKSSRNPTKRKPEFYLWGPGCPRTESGCPEPEWRILPSSIGFWRSTRRRRRSGLRRRIRVRQLVDGIKEHGLTLQNFASMREQQIGGIVQVGAHGTGASLPPIDEQVISMKLVTPAKGTIEVSKDKDPELFYLARCGIGDLGVVAEVTLQCVNRQELVEHMSISTMKEIKKYHKKLLSENKHVKYLYIPYTDTVVVVKCSPISKWKGPPKFKPKYSEDEALEHVRNLYKESLKNYRSDPTTTRSVGGDEPDIKEQFRLPS